MFEQLKLFPDTRKQSNNSLLSCCSYKYNISRGTAARKKHVYCLVNKIVLYFLFSRTEKKQNSITDQHFNADK